MILAIVLETIILGIIINLLPDIWTKGSVRQTLLLGGLLMASLCPLLFIKSRIDGIPITQRDRPFVFLPLGIGIVLLALWLGMTMPTSEETPHPVLVFTITGPSELAAGDEYKAVYGILQLRPDIEISDLDIKVYVKPDSEDWWQLSELKCFAISHNHDWRIGPDCVRFDPAYASFTVVAVLVHGSQVENLPGSIAPYRVEAIQLADLKDKVLMFVYGEDESSISRPFKVSRRPITAVPTTTAIATDTATAVANVTETAIAVETVTAIANAAVTAMASEKTATAVSAAETVAVESITAAANATGTAMAIETATVAAESTGTAMAIEAATAAANATETAVAAANATATALAPTITPTPSPTPTIPPITDPPKLLEPPEGASSYRNRTDLVWEWPGVLGPDDYFQVEIRNRKDVFFEFDEFVPVIDRAWVQETTYHYDVIDEAFDREYKWRIIVVRGIPPGEKQWSTAEHPVWEPSTQLDLISEPSEMRTLFVEPGDEPAPDGGNGDNGGNGGGCYDEYGRKIPC